MKTDIYTKIVLTVIAVFLCIIIVKDIDFVSKAQANPVALDLSALNMEQAENNEDMTFFIYENSKIKEPFSQSNYEYCLIDYKDMPTHIITNQKPSWNGRISIKKNK